MIAVVSPSDIVDLLMSHPLMKSLTAEAGIVCV